MNFSQRYAAYRTMIDEALLARMDALVSPEPLLSAMRYSLLADGKRLRAVLLLSACEMAGGVAQEALPFACAMEMIHVYSLIHDDLPSMDNDDLRRGKPTNHKVFGEGMALLAGDGLLSLAFETMLGAASAPRHVEAMRRIASAAGVHGMVAGQCMDMHAEAQGGADELLYIHHHKTADLFIGAVTAGLVLAGAEGTRLADGERFAKALGLAFQIQDDLLDIEGDVAALGKQTGMDAQRGKLTWPGLHGMESAKETLHELTEEALESLSAFERPEFLRALAAWLLVREN